MAGLWVHPQDGIPKEYVNLILHKDPPVKRIMFFFDEEQCLVNQESGLAVHLKGDTRAGARLMLVSNRGQDALQFTIHQDGRWIHKSSGLLVVPKGGPKPGALLVLENEARAVEHFEFVPDQAWTARLNHAPEP
mmetsp:Transcript_50087/g.117708  ORF Transcript_50087/g.117708 Transcript_50087/m.117708 type:complete len:134 (-) Transcript_50087:13-414(-)